MSWTPNPTIARITGAAAVLTTLVLASAAGIAATGISPAAASTMSGPVFGPFGMTPSPAVNGQPRPYFNFQARPGQAITDSVIVTNLSSRPERLRLAVSKGVTATNSATAYENIVGHCKGPSCWISHLPHRLLLAPRERRLVGFEVKVPRHVRPGQYLAGVTLLAAKKPRAVRVSKRGPASAKAIIIDEVTVGVAVTIGNPAHLPSGLRVGQVTTIWIGRVPRLNIPVHNTGKTFLHASGRIRCGSGGHAHSYRVIMRTVLPGQGAVLPVNARGLQIGSVPCTVRLHPSSGHLTRWSGTVRLASTTVTRTYHPAKGVYVALPEQTMPFWAIALLVLGGVILLALVTVIAQRRRVRVRGVADGRSRALNDWFPPFRRA